MFGWSKKKPHARSEEKQNHESKPTGYQLSSSILLR